jgi:hypothetical protein
VKIHKNSKKCEYATGGSIWVLLTTFNSSSSGINVDFSVNLATQTRKSFNMLVIPKLCTVLVLINSYCQHHIYSNSEVKTGYIKHILCFVGPYAEGIYDIKSYHKAVRFIRQSRILKSFYPSHETRNEIFGSPY